MEVPLNTAYKIGLKMLQYSPNKIKLVQSLETDDPGARESFALDFLTRMEVDDQWRFYGRMGRT